MVTKNATILAGEDPKYIESNNKALSNYGGIAKAYFSTFNDLRPSISGRPQFDRGVYEHFRPGESLPKNYKDVIASCDNMYYQFTLVRNIIDLMSDFACQGIKLVHPIKSIERFYNSWFEKINGFDRSERFLNYLYRHAMVVVEARVGKINKPTREEFKALGADEVNIVIFKPNKNEIPLDYVFHHPALVFPKNPLIINEETEYYVQVNQGTNSTYLNSLSLYGFDKNTRILPKDKTCVFYYKRDDWQNKPIPFLYPLIKHAIMLEKLNLADSAALDGAISAVRIFKLGNLEHKLAPTDLAVAKLNEILQSHVGGGTLDLIWGPDIELVESNTNVHQFLGEAKYTPHLEQMYIGLGIPPTLAGRGGSGTTNNYISLKTLTKRLQYGRRQLISFWNKQIKWVQKSMSFARPAKIEFDFLDLGDEQTEKQLLIQLADRNLISEEKLQSIFGHDPEMEKSRINREHRERKTNRRVPKISSLPDSLDVALKKISLQKGFLTPAQLGLLVESGTESEKTPFDKQMDVQKQRGNTSQISNKGKKPRGRPSGSKDSNKRKKAAFKPKIKAAMEIWAIEAQNKINNIIKPEFLRAVNKSNFRQLTTHESKQYEKLLFSVLLSVTPFTDMSSSNIITAFNKSIPDELFIEYLNYCKEISTEIKRELTLDETRQIQALVYSSIFGESLNV